MLNEVALQLYEGKKIVTMDYSLWNQDSPTEIGTIDTYEFNTNNINKYKCIG